MIPFDQVEARIGHAPGGVCPFGINEGIEVYLDDSLKQFTTVYPAAGNDHSAVKLTIPELEQAAGAKGWVDVTSRSTQTRSPQNLSLIHILARPLSMYLRSGSQRST